MRCFLPDDADADVRPEGIQGDYQSVIVIDQVVSVLLLDGLGMHLLGHQVGHCCYLFRLEFLSVGLFQAGIFDHGFLLSNSDVFLVLQVFFPPFHADFGELLDLFIRSVGGRMDVSFNSALGSWCARSRCRIPDRLALLDSSSDPLMMSASGSSRETGVVW